MSQNQKQNRKPHTHTYTHTSKQARTKEKFPVVTYVDQSSPSDPLE